MASRESGPQPNQPPPFRRINWQRPNMHWEEIGNNALATKQALVKLVQARGYEEYYGKPMHHVYEDMDSGTLRSVPMDQEWRAMVLTGIVFEQKRLKRNGIVFDPDDQA